MRRTLCHDPKEAANDSGPYMDDEQARDQYEADAAQLCIDTDDDLIDASFRLLGEALADAEVAVSEYERDQMRQIARAADCATL